MKPESVHYVGMCNSTTFIYNTIIDIIEFSVIDNTKI